MKFKHFLTFSAFIGLFLLASCGSQKGLTVQGTIDNATNLSVFFDKKDLNNTATSLDKIDSNSKGKFSFNFPDGITPGVYRVRIGAKSIDLVMDGTEKNVKIAGDLQNLEKFSYTIEGAPLADSYRSTMSDFASQKLNQQTLMSTLDSADPLVSMALANSLFAKNPQLVGVHKNICERLSTKYPGVQCVKDYESMVKNLETAAAQAQKAQSRGKYAVQVGDPAPEIALPDVNGKTRKLSDLKGSIVLLDFWASWCGPCRRANPGVVETYHKYKDDGFTVFSVSLDGLDSRTKARFNGDQTRIAAQIESSKKRWLDAIAKDKLAWDNHVSDLKKWESQASGLYGVRSIPTTFLLNREGNIAALNPRHTQIEAEIKKLL